MDSLFVINYITLKKSYKTIKIRFEEKLKADERWRLYLFVKQVRSSLGSSIKTVNTLGIKLTEYQGRTFEQKFICVKL